MSDKSARSAIRRAEQALHQRTALACEAAAAAGVPGTFRVWAHDGVQVVLTTDPDAALSLRKAGLIKTGDRILAIRQLTDPPDTQSGIVAADERFAQILLAGYELTGTVAEFIAAEHRHPTVKRYLAIEDANPIAAAAMTIHDDVAVLGGASTLREHRGKGAQSRLLRHRIRAAIEADCTLAVATASNKSTSAANLERAGFTLHQQQRWTAQATLGQTTKIGPAT
jgi:ribosomal protein S18 acetylase RimI-like enzyme